MHKSLTNKLLYIIASLLFVDLWIRFYDSSEIKSIETLKEMLAEAWKELYG